MNLSFKLKYYDLVYLLLVFALLNAPLRLSENGMTSLFRIFSIVPFFLILVNNYKKYKNLFLIFTSAMIYSFLVSCTFYQHISWDQNVFILYDFVLLVIILYLYIKDKDFDCHFFSFLNIVTMVTLLAAVIQYYTGYDVPYIETSIGQPVGVYLSNGNELSSALCCMFIIYMYLVIQKKQYKYLLHSLLILFIAYINDAKLSLMGAIIAMAILFVYRLNTDGFLRRLKSKSFLKIIVLIIILIIVVLYLINPSLKVRDYYISLRELIFDAVFSILQGKELNVVGSIHDRTSAIIYGMRELKNTFFFGIGAGNSIVMLQMPQYYLPYAKSMHNILFQFLVEFGFIAITAYIILFRKIIHWFVSVKKTSVYLLKGAFCAGFIFISSQSSVGILSNYYTILVLFYVFLLKSENFTTGKIKLRI